MCPSVRCRKIYGWKKSLQEDLKSFRKYFIVTSPKTIKTQISHKSKGQIFDNVNTFCWSCLNLDIGSVSLSFLQGVSLRLRYRTKVRVKFWSHQRILLILSRFRYRSVSLSNALFHLSIECIVSLGVSLKLWYRKKVRINFPCPFT